MQATIGHEGYTIFDNADAAQAIIDSIGDDEDLAYLVVVDPLGSGRATVHVLDAETGDDIGLL